jgi:hypothetical protein
MKSKLVISLLCCSSALLLFGCASTENYMNDTFSVEKRACSKGMGKAVACLGYFTILVMIAPKKVCQNHFNTINQLVIITMQAPIILLV